MNRLSVTVFAAGLLMCGVGWAMGGLAIRVLLDERMAR